MSPSRSRPPAPTAPLDVLQAWAALTWDDLNQWAGARSVQRGRAYERQGRVTDLVMSPAGRLLATVAGGARYTTSVWLDPAPAPGDAPAPGGGEALDSLCTCPVGAPGCKHAVALVAAYLQRLADGAAVPAADPDDRRWTKLAALEDPDADFDDEDYDDEDEDDDADRAVALDEEGDFDTDAPASASPPRARARRRADARAASASRAASRAGKATADKLRQHISAKNHEELVELVLSLAQRFPDLREEFRERIALGEGDVDRLVTQARKELRAVTAEPGWHNHWDGEGYTPDYRRLQHRLERMVELGHADAVVPLGRELVKRGFEQIGQSDDEGETISALAAVMPVVFQAVAASTLPPAQKLLFAIDAMLQEEWDVIGAAADVVLEATYAPADWVTVAEELVGRLQTPPRGPVRGPAGDFYRSYERDKISNWLARALEHAGQGDQVLALYEAEARATGSYERLVRQLIELKRYDDAQRWAAEGIAATLTKLPGIAAGLANQLEEVARARQQWDVVAAHAAGKFFDQPGVATFEALAQAAAKAGCGEAVKSAARRFLETGAAPLAPAAPPAPRKGKQKDQGKDQPAAPTAPGNWPLPMPEYLRPLLGRERHARGSGGSGGSGPLYDVLIDLAIAQKQPDEALHWYDRMRAHQEGRTPGGGGGGGAWYGYGDPGDKVAAAVAKSHPHRALEIYRQRIAYHLPQASPSAYETVAGYLRKLRPILASLHLESDWQQLLTEIRTRYHNRPRFMEVLDQLDARPIVQTQRARR